MLIRVSSTWTKWLLRMASMHAVAVVARAPPLGGHADDRTRLGGGDPPECQVPLGGPFLCWLLFGVRVIGPQMDGPTRAALGRVLQDALELPVHFMAGPRRDLL